MRIYLEASEIVPPGEIGEFVRLDVTDNTEAERTSLLADLKITLPNANYSRHTCNHDSEKLCITETV